MLENILIFILFLGPLVFFHELGHYFFARLFGVRVEVFSLGFGPKILRFKKGDTQYAVSLIPLGGYVKMFGDDPLNKDAIPEEERRYSFTHKGKWARFWIVMGGPLANFLMAYVIFFGLLMSGERVPEFRAGVLPQSSVLYAKGIRTHDRLVKVNDIQILNPTDIESQINTVTLNRGSKSLTLDVSMAGEDFFKEWVNYPPARMPIIAGMDGKLYALSYQQKSVDWDVSIDVMGNREGVNKSLYLFPLQKVEPIEQMNKALEGKTGTQLSLSFNNQIEFANSLYSKDFRSLDLVVNKVKEGSPANKAGLISGDVIVALDGNDVQSFDELRRKQQEIKGEQMTLTIWRDGAAKDVLLTPEIQTQKGKEIKLIGVYSSIAFIERKFVQTESMGLFSSLSIAVDRTWSSIVKTGEGFHKLITGAVSFKEVGGPLAIGSVATSSFHTSISYFFQVMALISVNLGLINLFPIPVLDGGHILFIFLEIVNRGPVSRRKMEIAQQIGLSLLLMLMAGALFNDYQRFFQ